MCFGSINPRIKHGADQTHPSRIIEKNSFSTDFHSGGATPSTKKQEKPFDNEASNLLSYPSWTGTLGAVSRQETNPIKRQSSFDREQAKLPVGYGWTDALSQGSVPQTIQQLRSQGVQRSVDANKRKKTRLGRPVVSPRLQ